MRACCLQRALTELIDGNFSLEVLLKPFLQGAFDPEFSAPLTEIGDGGDDDYRPTNCAERDSSFHGPRSRLVHCRTRPAGRLGALPTEPTPSRPANRPHVRSPQHQKPLTRPRRRRSPSKGAFIDRAAAQARRRDQRLSRRSKTPARFRFPARTSRHYWQRAMATPRTCAPCSATSIRTRCGESASMFEIDGEALARACRGARRMTAAANAELDEFAAQFSL